MIERDDKFYTVVLAKPSDIDLCYQCDYMQNKGFICGTCPDTPCEEELHTVLKEVDYSYK